MYVFDFEQNRHHLHLHSFPTRRSSDLHNLGNLLLLGKIGVFHNRRNASSRLLLLISKHLIMEKDRKSGSAGMPRPISYAVFCLKKKKNITHVIAVRNHPHTQKQKSNSI